MSRWVHSVGTFTILSIGMALPCYSQSTTAPPAASTPSTSDNSTNPVSKPADAAPATKKVWTNDDLGPASRSSVQASSSNKRSQQSTVTKPADQVTVGKVRDDLQRLQKQLDDTNKLLASFKQFQDGDSSVDSSGRALNKGYSRVPPDQQVVKLQEKRKKLQNQIGDLLDEARKQGIEPGQL